MTGQEDALLAAMTSIASKVSGGLTSFTAEAKHAFLNDIGRICVDLGFDVPAISSGAVYANPEPCGECHLVPGEKCDVCGAEATGMPPGPKYPHITVQLTGLNGNVFVLLGAVTQALLRAGVSKAEQDAFREEAMSGDYDNALATCMRWVRVT